MILITGAAGYVGSHCAIELLSNGFDLVLFDNLETGHFETVEALKNLSEKGKVLSFIQGDLKNYDEIKAVFEKYKIEGVIHFAANSLVEESIKNPQKYYFNNVFGSINLLKAMVDNNVKNIVFSSTAATYGEPQYVPMDELHPQNPINTYGMSKLMIEKILFDYEKAYGIKSVIFRYFNVAGADSKGRIGEIHNPETHLIPNIIKSTFGDNKGFKMFGSDYDTKDGTCVRDYINVEDLSLAHRLGLERLLTQGKSGVFNLGTQEGFTVKEIFDICEQVTEQKIDFENCPRRSGDPAKLVANSDKAKVELNWMPKRTIFDTIKSAYYWEKKLNEGYRISGRSGNKTLSGKHSNL